MGHCENKKSKLNCVNLFCLLLLFPELVITTYSSVIRQKVESQVKRAKLKTGVSRKQSTNVCVSGGKKCSFFVKFAVLCFYVLLPYYRRIEITFRPLLLPSNEVNFLTSFFLQNWDLFSVDSFWNFFGHYFLTMITQNYFSYWTKLSLEGYKSWKILVPFYHKKCPFWRISNAALNF